MGFSTNPTINAIPQGHQSITMGAGVETLTAPANGDVNAAFITVEAQAVRWLDDGNDPSATDGHVIPAGGSLEYTGNLRAFKAIRQAAGAILKITYYNLQRG